MITKDLKVKKDIQEGEGALAKQQEETLLPLTDVYANESEIYIESELVGVSQDSLDISLEDNLLTIHGSRSEKLADGYELKYAEFYSSSFKRQFKLEGNVDLEAIKASLNNGVLKLNIPLKKPSVKKIPILAK